MYPFRERKAALSAAVALYAHAVPPVTPETVLAAYTTLLARLSGARLKVTPDPLTYQQGNPAHSRATTYAGGKVQLTDTQQVLISVEPDDSKGFAVSGDQLTYTSADPAVVALQPSADGLSCLCVAGVPGSTVVTISDGTITGTEAFDVTPGAVASFRITEGVPEEQPPAAPPAA